MVGIGGEHDTEHFENIRVMFETAGGKVYERHLLRRTYRDRGPYSYSRILCNDWRQTARVFGRTSKTMSPWSMCGTKRTNALDTDAARGETRWCVPALE